MRYFGKVFAFVLFIIAIKFFNDGNMYWWFFMFAFVITSGFLVSEDEDDEIVEHCDECGYVNQACVCKPVSNKPKCVICQDYGYIDKCVCKPVSNISNNDYKATYDDSGHDDYIDTAMANRDAEIKYKTDDIDWNHVTDGDVEDFDDEGNPINTVY